MKLNVFPATLYSVKKVISSKFVLLIRLFQKLVVKDTALSFQLFIYICNIAKYTSKFIFWKKRVVRGVLNILVIQLRNSSMPLNLIKFQKYIFESYFCDWSLNWLRHSHYLRIQTYLLKKEKKGPFVKVREKKVSPKNTLV